MGVLDSILVPIDDSEMSAQAIEFSLKLAKDAGSRIIFCHSVDLSGAIAGCANSLTATDLTPVLNALEDECASLLSLASARATALGIPAESVELAGPPIDAILTLRKDKNVDAVVMGTHGRHGIGRFFLGSTTEGVIRQADVPVFAVPQSAAPASAGPAAPAKILIALDNSDPAEAALEFALEFAEAAKATIVFAHVVDAPFPSAIGQAREAALRLLNEAVAYAGARGVAAEKAVLEGDACAGLLDLAHRRHADLIAIGTHGRRGLHRLLLGSVAESVLRSAPVPVVVVRSRRPSSSGLVRQRTFEMKPAPSR